MKKIRALSLTIISFTVLVISAGCLQSSEKTENQPTQTPVLPTQPVQPTKPEQPKKPPVSGIANPASTYCINAGYKLELRQDDQGNQFGVCIFPDGKECEEWKFFRGECGQENSYCAKQGYKLEIRDNLPVCVFSDGSICLEADYAAGSCAPGMTPAAP